MYFFHPEWPIFHLDNHVLVLYKPAGLIMQRDRPGKANLLDLAKAWLKEHYSKPGRVFAGLVHRLDAPVAGVIVVARTSKAAARLSAQFRAGTVEKTYLAVVCGHPPRQADRLEHFLERTGRVSRVVPAPTTTGRQARLSYRVDASDASRSLLSIDLETGRHHQIRVQLAAIGCPIVGDISYGASRGMADGRIALMARRLAFDHPTQKTRLTFQTIQPGGWPWPLAADEVRPLWSFEDFQRDGLILPDFNTVTN
jgi:23S rRNA pseudouridine1911/1915/1917 synthase